MAGGDGSYAGLITQRDDSPGHVYAWDSEYDFNAFRYKRLHKGFAPAHLDHDSPLAKSLFSAMETDVYFLVNVTCRLCRCFPY